MEQPKKHPVLLLEGGLQAKIFDCSTTHIAVAQRNQLPRLIRVESMLQHRGQIFLRENDNGMQECPHKSPVSSMKIFGNIFITTSSTEIIYWTIIDDKPSIPLIIASNLGLVNHISIAYSHDWASFCVEKSIIAINLNDLQKIRLEGHQNTVLKSEFLKSHENSPANCDKWLLSVSEDRTFNSIICFL